MKSQSLIGDGSNRKPEDFYPTPPYATQALLDREKFIGCVWEPACGEGHMSKVLLHNYFTISTDLIDRGYGTQKDFLSATDVHDNIITNPPFSLGLEFVLQAKKLAKNKIAMLFKTQFLEGVGRQSMFLDTAFPLKCVYQFSKRLTFGGRSSGGMLAFAWFVWDKRHKGAATIGWI